VKVCEVDFNPEFIARVIPRLDWPVVVQAAEDLGQSSDLPKELIENYENDQEFLKKAHHVLMEIDIINGDLVCPESGRKFPISDGIPNMLLNEDEV
jgi:multifunctional methyltransferase subunit TRM112